MGGPRKSPPGGCGGRGARGRVRLARTHAEAYRFYVLRGTTRCRQLDAESE